MKAAKDCCGKHAEQEHKKSLKVQRKLCPLGIPVSYVFVELDREDCLWEEQKRVVEVVVAVAAVVVLTLKSCLLRGRRGLLFLEFEQRKDSSEDWNEQVIQNRKLKMVFSVFLKTV